jgi:hypothetical protein
MVYAPRVRARVRAAACEAKTFFRVASRCEIVSCVVFGNASEKIYAKSRKSFCDLDLLQFRFFKISVRVFTFWIEFRGMVAACVFRLVSRRSQAGSKPLRSKLMSTNEILAQVASKKITPEQAAALLEKANQSPLRLKVSEKGGVSLYGLNVRFPLTLYAGQWQRVLDHADEIRAFLKANADKLSSKPAKAA